MTGLLKRLVFTSTFQFLQREKHYISSSHLGLIRCLTPFKVRTSIASI